jgi:hypothetical protein
MKQLRIDELGRETQFVLIDDLVRPIVREEFERRLYNYALGFTAIQAIGGWRGRTEAVTIYRVATLTDVQRINLVTLLLTDTAMTDVYVVLPNGNAIGCCYEEPGAVGEHDAPSNRPLGRWTPDMIASKGSVLHGANQAFQGHGRPAEPLHGARDTGWPHTRRDWNGREY